MINSNFKQIFASFFKNRTNLVLFLVFLAFFVLFFSLMKKAFIILVFILASWIVKSYQKYIDIHLGFDLIMLSTVLTGYTYGFFVGSITGIACMFVSSIWKGRFNSLTLISYVLLIFVALFSSLMNNLDIAVLGILLTIIYDFILMLFSLSLIDGRISRAATFTLTHIFFNIWLFLVIAPKILVVM